jgi:DNA (cytosine-5)-methyltransferase 1
LCARDYKGLNSDSLDKKAIVEVFENHPQDSRVKEMGDTCQTVTSTWGGGGGNIPFVLGGQHPNAAIAENESPTLTNAMGSGGGHVPILNEPVAFDTYNTTVSDTNQTIKSPNGGVQESVGTIFNNMAVRKLTPVECERLQGFPDNYTNIKENCPDGHRYKAMGNSMAVPVMRWIGERINNYKEENYAV